MNILCLGIIIHSFVLVVIMAKLVRLDCAVQNYDWGNIGKDSVVARFMPAYDLARPYAELWMGTHGSGPSSVVLGDEKDKILLRDYIGHDLPFLFKVLSIAKALSVQAHPDKELAGFLHKKFPDVYKDGNHKPEMACATTHFECMCGFRPMEEIDVFLKGYPELVVLIGGELCNEFNKVVESGDVDSYKSVLKKVFTAVMTSKPELVVEQTKILLNRLSLLKKTVSSASRHLDVHELFKRLSLQYLGDVGVFTVFFLNCFSMEAGEAVYLPAGEPHAYLLGDCVECMACSDNVVRAGLTSKFRDVDVLKDMLTYKVGLPKILVGERVDKFTKVYVTPAVEFSLSQTVVPVGEKYVWKRVSNKLSILLVYSGVGKMGTDKELMVDVCAGTVLLVPADAVVNVFNSDKESLVFYVCTDHGFK